MLCIKCGREAVIGNFCENCFLEKEKLFDIEDFTIAICDCGSYYDEIWQKPRATDEIIRCLIEKKIKTKNKITGKKILLKKVGNRVFASVVCSGFISPCKKSKEEEKRISILIKIKKCDQCVKLIGGYYEAVLQIRGDYDNIFDKIKCHLPKTARIGKIKHGYDIRFLRKSDAAKVSRKLIEFEIKKSFKFVTTKKGKKLYRNYYSVR
jgi:NMD protein affecting ribosome stability and mRNA decay